MSDTFFRASSALDEETARAELYGLLAQLWYAAPDARTARGLPGRADRGAGAGAFLEEPWRATGRRGARASTRPPSRSEYDALFGGIGKPEVYLFGSHYLSGFLNEKPLARLRTELAALGLARDEAMSETEDHIAYLCEVMRYLIAGDDVAVANLTRQRDFFSRAPAALAAGAVRCGRRASRRRASMRRWPPSPARSSASRRRASTCWTEPEDDLRLAPAHSRCCDYVFRNVCSCVSYRGCSHSHSWSMTCRTANAAGQAQPSRRGFFFGAAAAGAAAAAVAALPKSAQPAGAGRRRPPRSPPPENGGGYHLTRARQALLQDHFGLRTRRLPCC